MKKIVLCILLYSVLGLILLFTPDPTLELSAEANNARKSNKDCIFNLFQYDAVLVITEDMTLENRILEISFRDNVYVTFDLTNSQNSVVTEIYSLLNIDLLTGYKPFFFLVEDGDKLATVLGTRTPSSNTLQIGPMCHSMTIGHVNKETAKALNF